MTHSKSPAATRDPTFHLVLNDFGRLGFETDEAKADEWTIVSNIAKGHYSNPVKVIAVNVAEGWCRDVIVQIAQAVFALGRRENSFSRSARDFIERTLGISLFFPTRWADLSCKWLADRASQK